MSVVVVDAGLGNIASVLNMIRKVGGEAVRSKHPEEIGEAGKLILPGVGAFDHGMEQIHSLGLGDPLRERADAGVPLLGICLGMHLLGRGSEEGSRAGLGVIDAEFRRFTFPDDARLPVPHVGWNHVRVLQANELLPMDDSEQRFYFTHSYHAVCSSGQDILATCEYGFEFPVAVRQGNVYGVQFHPEKSHRFGMALVRNFLAL